MASTNNIFENVLSDFKRSLNPKQLENFQFVTLKDVRETALRIQREQEQTKSLMNMTRLESFLEAMDQFGKVIEVFLNASSFVAFVWGPMKFILQTANTWTESFEALLDAYSQLGEHLPLLGQYESLFGSNPDMKRVLVLIYTDILEFHKRAIHFFSGKAWRQIFKSIWKDFNTRFKHILDSLSRHHKLILEQATVVHFQRFDLFIQQYERDEVHRRRILEQQVQEDLRQKYLVVLEWFSAARNTTDDHNKFRDLRSKGTGGWILVEEKVQNWIEVDVPESSILWLNGIPGAGKTMLASIVIDSLLSIDARNTTYFYCRENDAERNNCISILRGLLSQLLNQHRDLIPYCHDKMNSTGEVILTTTTLAQNLLKVFFEKADCSRVIIDGLDECHPDQRKLLLAFFTDLVDHCDQRDPGKLRVLFVSQNYSDIEKALEMATTLKLTENDNRSDIKSYVRDRSMEIQGKYDLDTETVEEIREMTCARSKGMFLYAKLVMDHLWALETKLNVLNEIRIYGFPEGLGDAYERIIGRLKQNLKNGQWQIACKLLGWMVCAKRPLNWREIQAAISLNPEDETFDFDKRKLRSDIQDYGGSLIQVLSGDRVELVHATAKMYIAGSRYIDRPTVELSLATICLRYLTFNIFSPDIADENLQSSIWAGSLSLQDYAVAKWMEHVHAVVMTNASPFHTMTTETQAVVSEMEIALEEFAIMYEMPISEDDLADVSVQDCEAFRSFAFHEYLLYIWNHVCVHAKMGPATRNDISIKAIGDALIRSRTMLENMTIEIGLGSAENAKLEAFYGDRRFKCSKVTCYYFHEGFKDARSRDKHIDRHDRPFSCTFPDCSIVEFGFSSNKDLEKHRRFFHPEMEEKASMFSAVTKPMAAAPYECRLCGKKFTRAFIHKNHLLSHTGTRPHACSECGKAFTRANDCRRHEKIHARRR